MTRLGGNILNYMKNYINAKQKVLRHLDVKKKTDHLVTIKIGPTDLCNFDCPHCSEDKTGGRSHPDLIELMNIVAPYTKSLVFSGNGEPTMHPDFLDAIVAANLLGLEVGLITNGSLIKDEQIDKYKELCTWIRISVDAVNEKTYAKVHGISPKVFWRVIETGNRLQGGNATVGAGFLIPSDLPTLKLYEWASKARELCKGFDYVQFRNFHGDTTDYSFLVEEGGLYKRPSNRSLPKTCYAGNFTKVIEPNGDVVWCCHKRGQKDFILGNVYDNPDCLLKSLEVDTSKCPLTCIHRNMNATLEGLFDPEPMEHENFI